MPRVHSNLRDRNSPFQTASSRLAHRFPNRRTNKHGISHETVARLAALSREQAANTPPVNPDRVTRAFATPSISGSVENIGLPTKDVTIYVTIPGSNGKKERYQVKANCPTNLSDADIQTFWENKLLFLAQQGSNYLPETQQSFDICVYQDGFEVAKGSNIQGTKIDSSLIKESCAAYATGNPAQLRETLAREKAALQVASPVLNYGAPAGIEHQGNSCYLEAALQSLANDPILAGELNLAADRIPLNTDKRNEKVQALNTIKEVVEAYRKAKMSTPPTPLVFAELQKLKHAIATLAPEGSSLKANDAAQHDAGEVLDTLAQHILECSPDTRADETTRLHLADSTTQGGKPSSGLGQLQVVVGNQQADVANYVDSALFAKNPQHEPVISTASGKSQSVDVTSVKTTYKTPPKRLDITFKRNQYEQKTHTPVSVNCQFILSGRHCERGANTTYKLSSVILHAGEASNSGHYTAIVGVPSQEGLKYYHMDGPKSLKGPMTSTECDNYLKTADIAKLVSKTVYMEASTVASAAKSTKDVATQPGTDATASSATAPSPSAATAAAPTTTEKSLVWGHKEEKLHPNFNGYRPKIHAVIGDASIQDPSITVLRFSKEDLSEYYSPTTSIKYTDDQKTSLKVSRVVDGHWFWRKGKLLQSDAVHIDQFIHVNPGAGANLDIEKAVKAGLTYAEKNGISRVAIPFVNVPGISAHDMMKSIVCAIDDFKKGKNGHSEVVKEIKLVVSKEQARSLPLLLSSTGTPSATATTAAVAATTSPTDPQIICRGMHNPKSALGKTVSNITNAVGITQAWAPINYIVRKPSTTNHVPLDAIELDSDPLSYGPSEANFDTAAFRRQLGQVIQLQNKKAVFKVHTNTADKVNAKNTEAGLKTLIEGLSDGHHLAPVLHSGRTPSFIHGAYKDNDITDIEIWVLPPEPVGSTQGQPPAPAATLPITPTPTT